MDLANRRKRKGQLVRRGFAAGSFQPRRFTPRYAYAIGVKHRSPGFPDSSGYPGFQTQANHRPSENALLQSAHHRGRNQSADWCGLGFGPMEYDAGRSATFRLARYLGLRPASPKLRRTYPRLRCLTPLAYRACYGLRRSVSNAKLQPTAHYPQRSDHPS